MSLMFLDKAVTAFHSHNVDESRVVLLHTAAIYSEYIYLQSTYLVPIAELFVHAAQGMKIMKDFVYHHSCSYMNERIKFNQEEQSIPHVEQHWWRQLDAFVCLCPLNQW